MADQRLYRIDRSVRCQHIEPLFTLNQDLILRRWDDLLRVAGSVKMGWVTASLLIGSLQGYRRQNALMQDPQEYGRLIKTVHIVRCLDSPEYRRSIGPSSTRANNSSISAASCFSPTKARFVGHSTKTRRAMCSA
jgi:TnpA family transposase